MMTRTDLVARICAMIAQSHGLPLKAVTDTARFDDDLGLDDLDVTEIEIEAEVEFRTELNPDPDHDMPATPGQLADWLIAAGLQIQPEPVAAESGAA